jgi:hypothetical protein
MGEANVLAESSLARERLPMAVYGAMEAKTA